MTADIYRVGGTGIDEERRPGWTRGTLSPVVNPLAAGVLLLTCLKTIYRCLFGSVTHRHGLVLARLATNVLNFWSREPGKTLKDDDD